MAKSMDSIFDGFEELDNLDFSGSFGDMDEIVSPSKLKSKVEIKVEPNKEREQDFAINFLTEGDLEEELKQFLTEEKEIKTNKEEEKVEKEENGIIDLNLPKNETSKTTFLQEKITEEEGNKDKVEERDSSNFLEDKYNANMSRTSRTSTTSGRLSLKKKKEIKSSLNASMNLIEMEEEEESEDEEPQEVVRFARRNSLRDDVDEPILSKHDIEELDKLREEFKDPKLFDEMIKNPLRDEKEEQIFNFIDEMELEENIMDENPSNEKSEESSEHQKRTRKMTFLKQESFPLFKNIEYYEIEKASQIKEFRVLFDNEEQCTPYYKHYYYSKPHHLYRGIDLVGRPIVVAVEKKTANKQVISKPILRAMIFSVKPLSDSKDAMWAFIPADCKSVRQALAISKPELAALALQKVVDPLMEKDLLDFEDKMLQGSTKYKFGVLYIKKDQVEDENKMYSNVDVSANFCKFMDLMGEKVELKNFKKFTGGLNTSEDLNGTHSYYSQFKGLEIMYHVSTMIPFVSFDEQQLGRKKYLGNDIVVLIFCDDKTVKFNPAELRSQFNHVFVMITVESEVNGVLYYRVGVMKKPGVGTIQPQLPDPPVFPHGERFKDFLTTKLINSERIALGSEIFMEKLLRTRVVLLEQVLSSYLNRKQNRGSFFKRNETRRGSLKSVVTSNRKMSDK